MKFLSICRKVYNTFRGRDVIAVQQNIIDSLENELSMVSKDMDKQIRENNILQSRINELGGIRVAMQKELHELASRPDTVVVEKQFVMTQQIYEQFERSLEAPILNNNTTAHGAGYLCGIQRALTAMRQRFVSN